MAAQRADLDKYLASAVNNINARNEESATNIATFSAESLAGIASAKEDFSMRLDTLTNVVAANHKSVESGFEVLTSVMCDFKEQGEADRALIVKQNAALAADMQKAIIVAIQDGEAKTYRLVRMFLYQDVVVIQNLSRNEPVT